MTRLESVVLTAKSNAQAPLWYAIGHLDELAEALLADAELPARAGDADGIAELRELADEATAVKIRLNQLLRRIRP